VANKKTAKKRKKDKAKKLTIGSKVAAPAQAPGAGSVPPIV